MDQKTLDANWQKEMSAAFTRFVDEHIGWKEAPASAERYPACFGTGDDRSYCSVCIYRRTC